MKPKKILLVPNVDNPYDIRMLHALGEELKFFGHEYIVARSREFEYVPIIDEAKIDIVLAVNKARPRDRDVRSNVRYVSWQQDVRLDSSKEINLNSNDILYTLGTPEQLGLLIESSNFLVKPFYTGVNETNRACKSYDLCDFSFCAGLPLDLASAPPSIHIPILSDCALYIIIQKLMLASKKRNFFGLLYDGNLIHEMKLITEQVYQPVQGSLDIHEIEKALRSGTSQFYENAILADRLIMLMLRLIPERCMRGLLDENSIRKLNEYARVSSENRSGHVSTLINWMSHSYPRIYERRLLVQAIRGVSEDIHIYGNCMDRHDFSAPYYKGVLDSEQSLADVYANSKVSLGNNTHGLGLHSRNLGVMAAGGFLLHHRSSKGYANSLESNFEEGMHYMGFGDLNELKDVARTLLGDSEKRLAIGMLAQKKVFQQHTWRHRASELLEDLC